MKHPSNHCALDLMNTVIDGWFLKTFSASKLKEVIMVAAVENKLN